MEYLIKIELKVKSDLSFFKRLNYWMEASYSNILQLRCRKNKMNLGDAKCKGQEIFLGQLGVGAERWPGWAGDLKVITAGMSQVRPHFDE